MKSLDQKSKNSIISELRDLIYESVENNLDNRIILRNVSNILIDANIDSEDVIDILEDESFGEEGKDVALEIKIYEGW
ncbi:MAG: hypothetical protein ACOCZ5_00720 [bacterium]